VAGCLNAAAKLGLRQPLDGALGIAVWLTVANPNQRAGLNWAELILQSYPQRATLDACASHCRGGTSINSYH